MKINVALFNGQCVQVQKETETDKERQKDVEKEKNSDSKMKNYVGQRNREKEIEPYKEIFF